MKFSNGFWSDRDAYKVSKAIEVTHYEWDGSELKLYVAHKFIEGRSDELNLPVTSVTLYMPSENIIGVKSEHFQGIFEKGPVFPIAYKEVIDGLVEFNAYEDSLVLINDHIKVMIRLKPYSLEFYYDDEFLTKTFYKSSAAISDVGGDNGTFMREQLGLSIGEKVYGLGERFTPFVPNNPPHPRTKVTGNIKGFHIPPRHHKGILHNVPRGVVFLGKSPRIGE